jgi:DNA-binding PadR family transcriptional regulator
MRSHHSCGRHARSAWPREGRDGYRHGREERHGWGGHRRGGGRFFDQGDLRYLILALVAEKPRHGYDIIKDIEERFSGAYAPSPGVVYPMLTMLEELGHVSLASSEGGKKLYAITPQGEASLKENEALVRALFERIEAVRARVNGGRVPQITRAMENLRFALRLQFERAPLSEEQAQAIALVLDNAAQAIDKI